MPDYTDYYTGEVIGASQLNTPCQFPFIYKEKTYYSCTYDNFDDFNGVPSDFDGQPWCSVATDLENNHIWSQYGICDDFELCPLPQPTSWKEQASDEEIQLVKENQGRAWYE